MEYILLYQLCSLINNFCYPPLTDRELTTYSQCVSRGAEKTIINLSLKLNKLGHKITILNHTNKNIKYEKHKISNK